MFSSLDSSMMMAMGGHYGKKIANSDDFVETMLDVFRDKINQMKERIVNNHIVCSYRVGKVSLKREDRAILDLIKSYEPYQIDWSNIGDYFTNKDFVEMTRLCSV